VSVHTIFVKKSKESGQVGDIAVDERILGSYGIVLEAVAWIRLAENSDRWLAVVRTVMNLGIGFVWLRIGIGGWLL
jgi:hypothetical protein